MQALPHLPSMPAFLSLALVKKRRPVLKPKQHPLLDSRLVSLLRLLFFLLILLCGFIILAVCPSRRQGINETCHRRHADSD